MALTTYVQAKDQAGALKKIGAWLFGDLYLSAHVPTDSAGNEIVIPAAGSGADGSGTITTGGTAQTLFSGSTPSNGFLISNPDSSEALWISLHGTAAANANGSICIPALGTFTTPASLKPSHAVSIVGATTGHKFTAEEW